jgi:hypothetical protein
MTDARLQRFLELAINSPVKLQITVLFADKTISRGSAREISLRAARDIWSITDALEGLTEARVLRRQFVNGEAIYVYEPAPELRELLAMLVEVYDDPLSRDDLQRSVRALSLPLSYHHSSDMLWGIA